MDQGYPLYSARGSHRALGLQHGEQARVRIAGFLDYLAHLLVLSRDQMRSRAMRFLPLFEANCPHLLDEVRGLADGAGVPFADALAVQIRGELSQLPGDGCTTFVLSPSATAEGTLLIGQNSDVEPELGDFAYLLRLEPEEKPSILMWTFGGMIGYHGMNAAGVAHFANSLGGGPAWRFALPHYPVKRLILEQSNLEGVFQVLYRVPVCSSGNYVLCDGQGQIADVELTPDGFARMPDDETGFLAHSNHFVCRPHACPQNDNASLPDSFGRMDRIRELLSSRVGRPTVEDMKHILSDHRGYPGSICRHPHTGPDHPSVSARGRTTASLIAEPQIGRMHVSRGNPCENLFTTYELSQ